MFLTWFTSRVSWNFIELKEGNGGRMMADSLPSWCFHSACQREQREECNRAIYSNCCRLKKDISLSSSPPSAHRSFFAWNDEKSVADVLPLPSFPLILSSSYLCGLPMPLFRPSQPRMYNSSLLHSEVAHQSWIESGGRRDTGAGNEEPMRGSSASCQASQVEFV